MLNEIYKEFKLSFIFIKRKFLIKRKFWSLKNYLGFY
jgi:hypothetical protein